MDSARAEPCDRLLTNCGCRTCVKTGVIGGRLQGTFVTAVERSWRFLWKKVSFLKIYKWSLLDAIKWSKFLNKILRLRAKDNLTTQKLNSSALKNKFIIAVSFRISTLSFRSHQPRNHEPSPVEQGPFRVIMIYGVWCEFYTRTLPSLWKTAETKTAIKDPVNYVRQVLSPYHTTGAPRFSECFCRDLHLHRTVQLQCNLHYNYCARSIAHMLIQSQAIKGRSVYSVVKRAADRGMRVRTAGTCPGVHGTWNITWGGQSQPEGSGAPLAVDSPTERLCTLCYCRTK